MQFLHLLFLLSISICLGYPITPRIEAVKIPIPTSDEITLNFFQVVVERFEQTEPLWMMVEVTDSFHYFPMITTNWTLLEDFKSCYNQNDSYASQFVYDSRKTEIRAALSNSPNGDSPNWSKIFKFSCCTDFIRPKNQTTLVLSGTVDQYINTNTQKVHIKDGTVLKSSVDAYWEVTFEGSVTFTSDFFGYTSTITTHFPVHLGNTTATIWWQDSVPDHQEPSDAIEVINTQLPGSDMFARVLQEEAKVCKALNLMQEWSTPHLKFTYYPECSINCSFDNLGFYFAGGVVVSIILLVVVEVILYYKTQSMDYYKQTHIKYGVFIGVELLLGFMLSAVLITMYYVWLNDTNCNVWNSWVNRIWGMFITPTVYLAVASIAGIVWISKIYCNCCYPEDVMLDKPQGIPRIKALQYFILLLIPLIFIWAAFALPPFVTWEFRTSKGEYDFFLTLFWLISVMPILGVILIVQIILISLASTCPCMADCFQKQGHNHEENYLLDSYAKSS